jgi:hypothetical protein
VNVLANIYLIGLASQTGSIPEIHSILDTGQAVVSLDLGATIENLNIRCLAGGLGEDTDKSAIRVEGDNVNIRKCAIKNSYSDGINVSVGASVELRNSVVRDVTGEGFVASENSVFLVDDTRFINTSGTAVWAMGCDSATLQNSIIYETGWHGIDLVFCLLSTVEHCTIVNFSNNNSSQSGINVEVTGGADVTIKSNLIEMKNLATLVGVYYRDFSAETDLVYKYNYIYSKQQGESNYYAGDISLETVDLTNYPNVNSPFTDAPLIMDPVQGDFRLDPNSPALGLGESGSNPGAQGAVLEGDL